MFSDRDRAWMRQALHLAEVSASQQEVPVGAVLVLDDRIVGEGGNCPITACDPTAHAEIVALRQGAKNLGNYRLTGSTLYVTLEPCLMCIGAIAHARVQRVVYGAVDTKENGVASVSRMGIAQSLNHRVIYEGGLLAELCGQILDKFFQLKRG